MSQDSAALDSAHHWDRVYANRDPTSVSWFQAVPTVSLELVELHAGIVRDHVSRRFDG